MDVSVSTALFPERDARTERRAYIHKQKRLPCVELSLGLLRNSIPLLGVPHCVRFLMCVEGQDVSP